MKTFWILIFLFLSSCGKPPAPQVQQQTILRGVEADEYFWNLGVLNTYNADARYAIPLMSWVHQDFTAQWGRFLEALGPWTTEENDCDDFARFCAGFASLIYHNTPNKEKDAGFALGEFWYLKDNGGAHAICAGLARLDGTTNVVVYFFEPQPGADRRPIGVVQLSQKEIESCMLRKF